MPKKTKSMKKSKSKKVEISDVDNILGDNTDFDNLENLKQNVDKMIDLETSLSKSIENIFENFGTKLYNVISHNVNDVIFRFLSDLSRNLNVKNKNNHKQLIIVLNIGIEILEIKVTKIILIEWMGECRLLLQ